MIVHVGNCGGTCTLDMMYMNNILIIGSRCSKCLKVTASYTINVAGMSWPVRYSEVHM